METNAGRHIADNPITQLLVLILNNLNSNSYFFNSLILSLNT